MTKKELTGLVKEVIKELEEANTSGAAGAYLTPYAFRKGGDNRAVKALKKLGYKKIKRPARPSNTKLVDYL